MLGKIYWSRKRRWSAWKMQQGDTWLSLSCRLLTMEHLQNPPSQLFRASSKDIFVKYVLYSWWFTWVSGTLHCITHSNIKDEFFKSFYFTSTWADKWQFQYFLWECIILNTFSKPTSCSSYMIHGSIPNQIKIRNNNSQNYQFDRSISCHNSDSVN